MLYLLSPLYFIAFSTYHILLTHQRVVIDILTTMHLLYINHIHTYVLTYFVFHCAMYFTNSKNSFGLWHTQQSTLKYTESIIYFTIFVSFILIIYCYITLCMYWSIAYYICMLFTFSFVFHCFSIYASTCSCDIYMKTIYLLFLMIVMQFFSINLSTFFCSPSCIIYIMPLPWNTRLILKHKLRLHTNKHTNIITYIW